MKISKKKENELYELIHTELMEARAINTFKEMEKQLAILKQDVSFREYVGFEMCMKIFWERYEKWIVVNGNDR